MICQRYRTLIKKECPSINQCLKIATVAGKPYIITGGNEQKVYIYNINFEIIQTIDFDGWIRDCIVIDLDHDKNDEFAIASGDNTLRIFKFTETKFAELWRYTFDKKVTAVAGGDINLDNRDEIIAGSWDGSVKVFDAISGTLLWELQFSDWITSLKILDTNWDGIPEIVLGLKKGQMGIINGTTGECYWDFLFPKRMNDCDLVVLSNNEYPHLLVGGDDNKLYCFDYMGNLIQIVNVDDRILTLTHGDIDGDGSNEVILGLANKHLVVYSSHDNTDSNHDDTICLANVGMVGNIEENTLQSLMELNQLSESENLSDSSSSNDNIESSINHSALDNPESAITEGFKDDIDDQLYKVEIVKTDSTDIVSLKYRWKATLPNAATNICVYDLFQDHLPKIVLTGYFKELRVIEDIANKKKNEVQPIFSSKLKNPSPKNQEKVIRELLDDEYDEKSINDMFIKNDWKQDFFFFPKKILKIEDIIFENASNQSENLKQDSKSIGGSKITEISNVSFIDLKDYYKKNQYQNSISVQMSQLFEKESIHSFIDNLNEIAVEIQIEIVAKKSTKKTTKKTSKKSSKKTKEKFTEEIVEDLSKELVEELPKVAIEISPELPIEIVAKKSSKKTTKKTSKKSSKKTTKKSTEEPTEALSKESIEVSPEIPIEIAVEIPVEVVAKKTTKKTTKKSTKKTSKKTTKKSTEEPAEDLPKGSIETLTDKPIKKSTKKTTKKTSKKSSKQSLTSDDGSTM
jgi:hypothetical protein